MPALTGHDVFVSDEAMLRLQPSLLAPSGL